MQAFEKIQTPVWLGGLAGLIPFYASIYGIDALEWPLWAFLSYAWIILAFLCGSVWRTAMENGAGDGAGVGVVLALGVPALLWLSYWVSPALQLGLTALGFLTVYVWERVYSWESFPAGYRVLRTTLTTLVLLAHLILVSTAL
jgi:hypothetical protein